jgi:nitrogen regulatory protein PII
MLKLVVTYIDSDKFDAVRNDLAGIGISHLAAITVGSATPETFTTMPYRGSAHTLQLTEKTRLEFVVHGDHLESVKEAIFRHSGPKTFVFTIAVDEALPDGAANVVSAAAG